MCEGIRQLIGEGKNEGRTEGIFIGRNEGISIGSSSAFNIIKLLKAGVSPDELIDQGNDKDMVQEAMTLI